MLMGEAERSYVFILANCVLSNVTTQELNSKDRDEVLANAARVIAYDNGFKEVKGLCGLTRTWRKRLYAALVSGVDQHPLRAHYKGRTAYTDTLERAHPGYIRELYRYAEKTLGNQASYEDLARTMNAKSKAPFEDRPDTTFNKMNLHCWFLQQGSKQKPPLEKPYLSEDQKKERKKW